MFQKSFTSFDFRVHQKFRVKTFSISAETAIGVNAHITLGERPDGAEMIKSAANASKWFAQFFSFPQYFEQNFFLQET